MPTWPAPARFRRPSARLATGLTDARHDQIGHGVGLHRFFPEQPLAKNAKRDQPGALGAGTERLAVLLAVLPGVGVEWRWWRATTRRRDLRKQQDTPLACA